MDQYEYKPFIIHYFETTFSIDLRLRVLDVCEIIQLTMAMEWY